MILNNHFDKITEIKKEELQCIGDFCREYIDKANYVTSLKIIIKKYSFRVGYCDIEESPYYIAELLIDGEVTIKETYYLKNDYVPATIKFSRRAMVEYMIGRIKITLLLAGLHEIEENHKIVKGYET